jgi:cytoskeletal protein CcmA (bactofilin family)
MLFSRRSDSPIKSPESAERRPERLPERVTEDIPTLEPLPTGYSRSLGVASTPVQSFIDASLTIVGDLHSAGDVRIDGRICGNVRCAQLILGLDAAITGSVVAEQVIVRGKVIGTIRAPVVVIQDTAHVESEITYASLSIDEGAHFDGAVRRRDNPLAEPEQQPSATAPATMAAAAPPAGDATESADAGATAESPPPPPKGTPAPKTQRQAPMANGHSPGVG